MKYTPRALIAEITHRCPLHCVYCSNPLDMQRRSSELSTDEWSSIFGQASALGILQVSLTGGEPLARSDTVDLVRAGHTARLYVNLITSGVGLNESRLDSLIEAGLDHVQLSLQDAQEGPANEFAGARTHALKLQVAEMIRRRPIGFTLNAVVHRQNLGRLEEIIAIAERTGAQRLEIANVQYYGWALQNRETLLPTREQFQRCVQTIAAARERLKGRLRIDAVLPDYYAKYPKACMGGWGHQFILIDPAGRAMPCHSAPVIPGLEFPDARNHPLRWIWEDSPTFALFRDEDWMPEPCRSCDRRAKDFGGCRCQAFLLTGNAAATDPICTLAPTREIIDEALRGASSGALRSPNWIYRADPV
jgi:pyrroloquinoline quinone biosynthesis protein E